MAITLEEAKARIDAIWLTYQASTGSAVSVLAGPSTSGKVYEAWVLSLILERLRLREGYDITLIGSNKVRLKSSPGPINRAYAHFLLRRTGSHDLEVWTDIEFISLSYTRRRHVGAVGPGDHHELDIVAVRAGTQSRPKHDEILLGVECKNTGFEKHMMRAALGVRRELSLLAMPTRTTFRVWPQTQVPANPSSVLQVYSTDRAIERYKDAGGVYGVDFLWEPMS